MLSRLIEGKAAHRPKTYKFGFSPVGFIAVLVPMIPNIFFALLPVTSTLPANGSDLPFVDVAGTVSQSLMSALLILLFNKRRRPTTSKRVLAAVAAVCLIGYLLLWVLYFTVSITPVLLLMMAVLPSSNFICVGLFLENYPSIIPASLFALIHIATTATNYL